LIKLLALDIDDTLIRGSRDVTRENLEAVAAARGAGVMVTVVTGRRWRDSADEYARLLETVWPVATVYGSQLVDARDGRVFRHIPLGREPALAMLELTEKRRYGASVLLGETVYLNRWLQERAQPQWPNVVAVADLPARVAAGPEEPTNLMVWEPDAVAGVHAAFGAELEKVQFLFHDVGGVPRSAATVISSGIDKGRALVEICALLGVDPAEVLAMGDSPADAPMLRVAGVGVAMGWAVDAVKEAADDVAAADDPHPVATMIEKHILGPRA
jgi:hydroxymethylpyrimidine pyrophosphatase-like HAD family hydrolase